jgi:hypothetical protein
LAFAGLSSCLKEKLEG